MQLKVFNEQEKSDEVFLALCKEGHDITVVAVDKGGKPVPGGNLVTFRADGTLNIRYGVYAKLGFNLNDNGQIITR